MSPGPKTTMHREEMRQLILEAAQSIFLEKGFRGASLRNIADRIGYSAGNIYLYFKDKDEIFHALHEEGFRRLFGLMQPLFHVSDPMERLVAMGRVYMEFALKNKELYDLMFIMEAPIESGFDKQKWEMGDRTLDLLKQILSECSAKGHFREMDVEYLSFMIWSGLHGMCALYCRKRCMVYEHIQEEELLKQGVEYFIRMVRSI